MIQTAQLCMTLFAVVAVVTLLAKRWKVPGPVVMVPAGLLLALIPGLPHVRLDPELALMLFLPPLIYSAAVGTSWPDFRAQLRPITLLAIGCVLFTTGAVAITAHYLIGMAWPVAFLLGAVVSPPDAVAATSIAGRLSVPRRIVTILEGEGMVNDATALTVYRFAIGAVLYGSFSIWKAGLTFALIVVCEAAWGLVVGRLSTWFRKWANDQRVEITLSLLTPFAAYWPAEHFGGSGVIAVVTAGLWVSWNSPKFISSGSRLQGWFFWDLLVYLVEGLLFLLTGLQFKDVIRADLGIYSWPKLLTYAASICAVMIVVRFVWVFPATYLPRLIPAIGRKDPSPPPAYPAIVAFAGMRGGISLAAALAIPYEVSAGVLFPRRELIIFITFCAILVTLVGQGLLLPVVIRFFRVHHHGKAELDRELTREMQARQEIVKAATERLPELAAKRGLPNEIIDLLKSRRSQKSRHLQKFIEDPTGPSKQIEEIELDLVGVERERLYDLFSNGEISDSIRRVIEHELDLQQERLTGLASREAVQE